MTETKKIMLTVQKCSEVSGLSQFGIRKLIEQGKLKHIRIGRKILVNQKNLFHLLDGTE